MVYIEGAVGGHDKLCPFTVEVCKDSAREKLIKGHYPQSLKQKILALGISSGGLSGKSKLFPNIRFLIRISWGCLLKMQILTFYRHHNSGGRAQESAF